METAIVSIICIALLVVGGMTMSENFLSSVDSSTVGLEQISDRGEEIMRTELATISATMTAADTLEVALRNRGQTKLTSFSKWDVIVQYYDSGGSYYVKWLPYTDNATPGDNEWTKKGIYLDAGSETAEVFEPGILNPGEEIVIRAKLNPAVGVDTTNLVVTSTPNGIPASISFSR
ncbi:hypothetical protein ACFLYE_00395 [Chloroflexota bacterium]